MNLFILTVLCLLFCAEISSQALPKFPKFLQCDPRWGNLTMGVLNPDGKGQDDTICHQGCAMSSLSMALNGFNITIDNQPSDPLSLNRWLRHNSGYTCAAGDCCNLVLGSVNNLSPRVKSLGEPLTPFLSTLVSFVKTGLTVIAHVQHQSHFVLVTGYAGNSEFYVNDPFFKRDTYSYSEIHDILLYDILPQ